MTSDSHFPMYRAGRATRRVYPMWLFGGLVFGIGMVANLYLLLAEGETRAVLGMLFCLAVVMSVTFGYASTRRSATITTREYIEVRTLFGTQRTAWVDIQEIETKGSTRTALAVVIRDGSGRRINLPFVNSRELTSFSEEVDTLRKLWERFRGPDWTPRPSGQGPSTH